MKTYSHFRILLPILLIVVLTVSFGGGTPLTTFAAAGTVTVTNTLIGTTAASIGANEGCKRFNIADLLDLGITNWRAYSDMGRFEPVDADGVYGSPTIAQIKANPNTINWAAYDAQFDRSDAYFFDINCPPVGLTTKQMWQALKDNNIRLITGLRPVDNKGNPTWMAANPQTTADWNEWWGYVFSIVYTLNVRYNLNVDDWEIHNEPDNSGQGWTGTLTDYIVFTQQTADAINYVYATYLGNRAHTIQAPVSTHDNTWIDTSLQQNDSLIDVVDWHRYGPPASEAIDIHNKIATYNSDGVLEPLHLSEWGSYRGYTSDGTGYGDWAMDLSFPASKVDTSSIFPMYDWGNCCAGLVHGDGTHAGAYYALRMVIRGTNKAKNEYQLNTTLGNKMIAAKDVATNTLYYTVINSQAGAQATTITLDVGAHFSSGTATVYLDDGVTYLDAQTSSSSFSGGTFTFTVPKNTNAQVIFTGGGGGPTATPTRTNTPVPQTNTPTRTNTPTGPTNTPTNTPVPPTATNTPSGPTATPGGTIPRTGWTVTCDSAASSYPCSNAIDGPTTTMWHTAYSGNNCTDVLPHWISIDMGATHQVNGLRYLPRQDGLYYKGGIGQYEIYVSADGINWGTAVATGTWASDATEKSTSFANTSGRYVQLKALTEADNNGVCTSATEINLTGQ